MLKETRSDTQCIFSSRKAQPSALDAKALQRFESLAKGIQTLDSLTPGTLGPSSPTIGEEPYIHIFIAFLQYLCLNCLILVDLASVHPRIQDNTMGVQFKNEQFLS